MILKRSSQGNIHIIIVIKAFDGCEKLVEVVTIVDFGLKIFGLLDDDNNVTHYVREDTYAKDKDDDANEPFAIASRMVVAKSNSGDSCHSIVDSNNRIMKVAIIVELEVTLVILIPINHHFQFKIAFKKPELSEKIAKCKQTGNQLKQFEK